MQVINSLIENSFAYTDEKENLDLRRDEIGELMEIIAYCTNEAVKEAVEYQEELWEVYVQEDITFADWLYGAGTGNEEDRRRFQEALGKREMVLSDRKESEIEDARIRNIDITLGKSQIGVSRVKEYIQERRGILGSIKNVKDYEAFMQSCFINSCFARGILSEMKHIDNFSDRVQEITKALGILNDQAIKLYQQYSSSLGTAMHILSTQLQRECAPDPKHSKDLVFSFTYSEQIEGKTVAATKNIECSPHFKLIHPGSDLRIYFYWCDVAIADGKKVLVGRIGRHPY
ncbi:MAG: hypothetical protein K2P87_13505 [Lachnospiraceae bacterium]|nr:hypothetical protein [Lachnospiraceae bacterium]